MSENEKHIVLGVGNSHDNGACVFFGEKLLSALNEERFDRVKLSGSFPPKRSIKEAIRVAGVDPREVRDIVISGLPPYELLKTLINGQLRDLSDFHGLSDYVPHLAKIPFRSYCFYKALKYRSVVSFYDKTYGIRPKLHFVDHHLCHAASVYRTAPFDDALIVTADGEGDDISSAIYTGIDGRISLLHRVRYPHSFGQFYSACTQILGFKACQHEGKITGLSAFGRINGELYRAVKSTIRKSGKDFTLDKRFYTEGIIRKFSAAKLREGYPIHDAVDFRNYKAPLKKLVASFTPEEIAAVFQKLLEEEVEALVRPFQKQTGLKNLALSGGVFANVKLNASLVKNLGMNNVYVFPHMGDGGLPVGAVLEYIKARPKAFDSVYWGGGYSEAEMEEALRARAGEGLRYQRENDIDKTVAELLADKKVVARFDGPMEFGPRALGNRSILCHAGDPEINTWLNRRLGRTEFMPFAPVVPAERAGDLFDGVSGREHACKFMTIVLDCKKWTREHCPAIVHVDGTARPQFVTEGINPGYYRILSHYGMLTGVPLLINTSFNMHEEPIVCSPGDAVRAFLRSKLDYMAIGPFLAQC